MPPEPASSILKHEVKTQAAPAKVFKPESRLQTPAARKPRHPLPRRVTARQKADPSNGFRGANCPRGSGAGRAAAGAGCPDFDFFFLRGMLAGSLPLRIRARPSRKVFSSCDVRKRSQRRDRIAVQGFSRFMESRRISRTRPELRKTRLNYFKLAGNQFARAQAGSS